MARTLTEHEDIREWTIARGGQPIIASTPTPTGGSNDVVRLQFNQPGASMAMDDNATQGMNRVEWVDWFKAFDGNDLALEVGDETDGELDSEHRFTKRS